MRKSSPFGVTLEAEVSASEGHEGSGEEHEGSGEEQRLGLVLELLTVLELGCVVKPAVHSVA